MFVIAVLAVLLSLYPIMLFNVHFDEIAEWFEKKFDTAIHSIHSFFKKTV